MSEGLLGIDKDKAAALAFMAALGKGDFEALAEASTEDLSWWWASTLPYGGFTGGRQAVIDEVLIPATNLYAPGTLTVSQEHVRAGEGFALVEWEIRGQNVAGMEYQNFYLFVIEVRDGKVSAVREYSDTQQTAEILWNDRTLRNPDANTYAR
jgi:ketosteroid isomerase-like protein